MGDVRHLLRRDMAGAKTRSNSNQGIAPSREVPHAARREEREAPRRLSGRRGAFLFFVFNPEK